jgi:uncharacterized hydrophobic protein (TIGR00271 family)
MASPVTGDDVARMSDALFIERAPSSPSATRFWVLLVLASIIATAGVMADSTATVIGAMIVAPLMTPILGIALATVLGDRSALLRSLAYVVGGALAVIGIAVVMGYLSFHTDDFLTNSQVAARINPRLIDLVAALATGTVGAFALVRRDISDTLPGVAIAISLVPPLAVVGLLLGVQRYADATGALLLFGTNVAAIIITGTAVLVAYRVRAVAKETGHVSGRFSRRTVAVVGVLLVLILLPLAVSTASLARDQVSQRSATPIAQSWADRAGWQVTTVQVVNGQIIVTALGPPPEADTADLRRELNEAGLEDLDLVIRLVVGGTRLCPAGGATCEVPDN